MQISDKYKHTDMFLIFFWHSISVHVTSKFRAQVKNAIAFCLCFSTSMSLVGLWNHRRSILLPIWDLHLFKIPKQVIFQYLRARNLIFFPDKDYLYYINQVKF